MNRPDFEAADLFWENDLKRGVGWVLIVLGVSVICDIGWDKSELRNMKNQNFEISECWNEISECWGDVSRCGNGLERHFYLKQVAPGTEKN